MKTTIMPTHYELAIDYFNQQNIPLAKKHLLEDISDNPKNIHSLKLLAFIEYQSNNYQQALNYLELINNIDENIAEINNLIGCVFLKTKEYDKCVHFFSKAIENDNQYIDAYTNITQALIALGHGQQAINTSKIALSINPNSISTLQQYAKLLFDTQQYFDAIDVYNKWLTIDPLSHEANCGLAKCYLAASQRNKALDILSKLKSLPDRSPLIRLDVTNEFLNYGEFKNAIDSYFEILNDVSDKAAIYNNIASAYDSLGNHEKAIEYFLQAISQDSQYVPALSNIGRVYTDTLNLKEAERHLSKALSIDENNVNAIINMGRLQDIKKNLSVAESYFKKALNIEPQNTKALYNMGNIYHQLGEFEKSSEYYKTCLSIDPQYNDAEQNLGINELTLGNFKTAWGHYFHRLRNLQNNENLSTIIPGMSLENKHVYFCRSQGIGDEIFFLRFLKMIKQENVTITYRASKKLYPLLASVKEIDHLLNENEATPEHCDYYFTIDDIPLLLNINDSRKIPPPLSLFADNKKVQKIKKMLNQYPPPYTAITWRSGTQEQRENIKDGQRDLSKILSFKTVGEIISPLNNVQGTLVIVQRNPTKKELEDIESIIKNNKQLSYVNFEALNEDLIDMLALLSLMDRYIGVSNTNTHLYAALNKKADVFIPFPPDWRWMAKGKTTPWFPGFHLYRQACDGNWNETRLDSFLNKDALNDKELNDKVPNDDK